MYVIPLVLIFWPEARIAARYSGDSPESRLANEPKGMEYAQDAIIEVMSEEEKDRRRVKRGNTF